MFPYASDVADRLLRQWPAERDLLLRRRGWTKNRLLYHVSLADQEYLVFSLWSHKWKASVTAETKPGGPYWLTANMTKKYTAYWPWHEVGNACHQDWTAICMFT